MLVGGWCVRCLLAAWCTEHTCNTAHLQHTAHLQYHIHPPHSTRMQAMDLLLATPWCYGVVSLLIADATVVRFFMVISPHNDVVGFGGSIHPQKL